MSVDEKRQVKKLPPLFQIRMIPRPLRTNDVINWYFDQFSAWLGSIIALILGIMSVRKLAGNHDRETGGVTYIKSFKLWVYSLYFSNLFFCISTAA